MCLLQATAWRRGILCESSEPNEVGVHSSERTHVLESNCFLAVATRWGEHLVQFQNPEGAR